MEKLHQEIARLKDALEKSKETGVVDKNGNMIKFGKTVRFVDKYEWYKYDFRMKFFKASTQEEYDNIEKELEKLPFEERKVTNHEDYEWLLSGEIQSYWEII